MKRLLLVTLMVMMGVGAANAFVYVGPPVQGGSWSQSFWADIGSYDFLRVDWISGSKFRVPVFTNFNRAGWSEGWSTSTSASASGPTRTADLTFNVWFEGLHSDPVAFYYHAYNTSNEIEDSARAIWNGSGWSITGADWDPPDPRGAPIPEPTSLILIGAGLGIVGVVRRMRKSA